MSHLQNYRQYSNKEPGTRSPKTEWLFGPEKFFETLEKWAPGRKTAEK